MSAETSPGPSRFDRYYGAPSGGTPGTEEVQRMLEELARFVPEGGSHHHSGSTHLETVRATELRVSGSLHVDGDVRSGVLHVSGAGHVGGNLLAREVETSGSLKVGGSITSAALEVSGSLRAEGGVCTERYTHVSGSMRSAWLHSSGGISVSGGIETGRIIGSEVEISGGGQVHAVHGGTVRINERAASVFGGIVRIQVGSGRRRNFRADEVVATGNALVDRCELGLLRADVAEVRRNAHIGKVEYYTRCVVEPGADVGSPPTRLTHPSS